MIKQALFVAAGVLLCSRIRVAAKEAEYLNSSFELNTPGYLYNIGARRYLGLDDQKHIDFVAVKNPVDALRIRVYINNQKDNTGFFFLEDDPTLTSTEADPSRTRVFNRKSIIKCTSVTPRKLVFSEYTGDRSTLFMFSFPMLYNENAFQIMSGGDCLRVDTTTDQMLVVGDQCKIYPNNERNKQMFAWVDVDTFNRGIDPITYKPNPYIGVPKPEIEDTLKKHCHRYSPVKSKKNPLFYSANNFPLDMPYHADYVQGAQPSYCAEYLQQYTE
ncbi:hypothetical protein NEOKW01_1365 [Nematocida sp. AWRm80]|nr:hypothetical protein NEOKW01_1365 [Nematocida sp. AWRm80]